MEAEADRGRTIVFATHYLQEAEDFARRTVLLSGGRIVGIEVAAQLAEVAPSVRSLIVTTFGRPGFLRRALDAGAAGFMVKDTPAPELADAVRRVNAGLRVVDPELATESLIAGTNPLGLREKEVLTQALSGAPVAEIAQTLNLSAGTVRNYLSSATAKTQARSSAEAAVIARDRGWL